MPKITNECPHCHVQNVLFGLRCEQNTVDAHQWNCFGTCHGCGKMIVAIGNGAVQSVTNNNGDARTIFRSVQIFPAAQSMDAPENTDPTVAGYYIQGLASLRGKHWDAAGTMFRKALEVSLKRAHSMEGKPTIYERINKLPDSVGVTPAMKTWAHRIRSLGADAAHEEEPFTQAEAQELHEFAEAFLTYFFTLPAKVAKHQPPAPGPVPS